MGCGSPREKIEDEMMVYKLERMQIQMEKENELKKLAEIEGHAIERTKIPDYIDPEFAKEKKIYEEYQNEDTDQPKNNKDKKKKNREQSSPKKKKKKEKN